MDQITSSAKIWQISLVSFLPTLLFCFSLSIVLPSLMAAPMQEEDFQKVSAEDAASQAVPRISLDKITGTPGASLMVPLYYTPDPNNPLRSLVVDIDYVSNHLKFQKISRGVFPEDMNVDLAANSTDRTPDAKGAVHSKLHVSVGIADKDAKKGLPDSLIAFLLFQVTMDAKPFSIKLTPTFASAEDIHTPPKNVAKIATVPGTVVVEIPDLMPEATCFFFSH